MKTLSTLVVLLTTLPLPAHAANAGYQEGTLTKVRSVIVGNACSTSTQSDAATYGNTARRTLDVSARCSDIRGAVYTVTVAGTDYDVTPDRSRVARASAYLPLSATFLRQSSLANHTPGTPVLFRNDPEGILIRVGKHESQYRIYNPAGKSETRELEKQATVAEANQP